MRCLTYAAIVAVLMLAAACATAPASPNVSSPGADKVDLGVRLEAPGIELAVDPIGKILDVGRVLSGRDQVAVEEAKSLEQELAALLAVESDPAKRAAIAETLTALRDGLRDMEESPPEPAQIGAPPVDGNPISWILWGLGAAGALGGLYVGRKQVPATLAKAIEAAKKMLEDYDREPYTPADVKSIEAAKEGDSRPVS